MTRRMNTQLLLTMVGPRSSAYKHDLSKPEVLNTGWDFYIESRHRSMYSNLVFDSMLRPLLI